MNLLKSVDIPEIIRQIEFGTNSDKHFDDLRKEIFGNSVDDSYLKLLTSTIQLEEVADSKTLSSYNLKQVKIKVDVETQTIKPVISN